MKNKLLIKENDITPKEKENIKKEFQLSRDFIKHGKGVADLLSEKGKHIINESR